jgi:hypothetical protein
MQDHKKSEEGSATPTPDGPILEFWLPFPRAAGAAKQQDGVREEPSSLRMARSLTPALRPVDDMPGVVAGIIDTMASLVCRQAASDLPRRKKE